VIIGLVLSAIDDENGNAWAAQGLRSHSFIFAGKNLMSDYQRDPGLGTGATGQTPSSDILNGASDLSGAGASPRRKPLDKALGKVEAVVSKTVGPRAAQKIRDRADAAVSQAEAALGQAESVYRSARFRVYRELANEPYKTLGIALGVGVVLGLILARRERTIIYRPSH
jgi:ElaB/YqjD/DUF883 family membrane-anchored ribosome-binding protein